MQAGDSGREAGEPRCDTGVKIPSTQAISVILRNERKSLFVPTGGCWTNENFESSLEEVFVRQYIIQFEVLQQGLF